MERIGATDYFDLAFAFEVSDAATFNIGVNNIFDKDPPTISDDNVNGYPRFGNFFANGAYDYRGRSFFVNVTRSFK